ncbi:hypothetical protein BD309DRAFT_955980 [Dichomitus squalens]|nr:hypothetical protein BD309DRAFT_955980 [Dichomitus squalens]
MPTTQTQLRGAERPDEDGYEDEGGGGKGRWGDEVHCTVQVQCIKAPNDPDSIFSDPDTFVLHLTTSSPLSSTRRPIQTTTGAERRLGGTDGSDRWRRIELGTYAGHPESLDAPPWTRLLPAGQVVEFRESAAGLAELLARAAPWNCEDAMTVSPPGRVMTPALDSEGKTRADVRASPAFAGVVLCSLCCSHWAR